MNDFSFDLPTNELIARRLRYIIQTEHNGSYAKLFEQLYDHAPDEGRLRLFKAYVDKGNVNGTFIRRLGEKTKIGQVSFAQFFDLYVDNEVLFAD